MKKFSELSKLTKISLIINAIILLIILVIAFRGFTDYKLLKKFEAPKYASLHYRAEEPEVRDENNKLVYSERQVSFYNGIFYDIYTNVPKSPEENNLIYDLSGRILGTKDSYDLEMKLFGKTIYEHHTGYKYRFDGTDDWIPQ